MTPPKPPRRNKPTITCSSDVPQSASKDPGASLGVSDSQPAVTDGSQSEVKPVPRPRSKVPSKVQCNTNTTVDTDETSDATNAVSSQLSEYAADYKRPCPARPPRLLNKSTAAINGGNHYMSSDTTLTPPAVTTERKQSLPPPRPPLPSIYCDREPSTMRLKSESYSDVSQLSRCSPNSSMQQNPGSTTPSEEGMTGIYETVATDSTDKPAIQPQLWESPLSGSASEWETLPSQSRLPPPPSNPPPLPSTESAYSEIEHRPYLDILPEDEDGMTQQRSTLPSGHQHQSGCNASHEQATADSEDINGMLRWLKRVSKTDFMALSVYGLSIEEEIRSFNHRAINVTQALRLYNLLMIKRNKCLRDLITELSSISNSLDKMQKKTKTMGIAGGTTGAVGGMTAVLGIALAPVTLGASLIATVVGAGMVASAGGMGAHTAKATKKIVNRMTVEKLVYEYEANVVDLELCLDFILSGMNELRRHDIARLHRAGAKPDAVKMVHLSQFVFRNNTSNGRKSSVSHIGTMSSERLLQAFAEEMDQYFTEKDGQTLKNSTKSQFSGRVRLLARNLQDELDHLNRMWEMFC